MILYGKYALLENKDWYEKWEEELYHRKDSKEDVKMAKDEDEMQEMKESANKGIRSIDLVTGKLNFGDPKLDKLLDDLRKVKGLNPNGVVKMLKPTKEEREELIKAIDKSLGFDTVERPSHYCEGRTYEPRKVIEDWGLDFYLGNVVKYISRAGRKGSKLEDLLKAKQYLDWELESIKMQEQEE
jgi:hypothetical protein